MANRRLRTESSPDIMPHDTDAEALVLSHLLYDPETMPERLFDGVGLVPAAFYRDSHRVLAEAILALYRAGDVPFLEVVVAELRESGKLEDVGGQAEVSAISSRVAFLVAPVDAAHGERLARLVAGLYAQRRSMQLAQRYAEAAHTGDWAQAERLRDTMAEVALGLHQRTSRFRLLTDEEVEHLPQPEMLVGNILVADTLAMIYGDTGTGKSFLAIDLALHIALGKPWDGHPVKQGAVVYIAAEGAAGMSKRVRAWKQHYGVTGPTGLSFIGEACQLLDSAQVGDLLATLAEMPQPPVCVVIDTLGRSMDGGDENANSDIHRVIASADAIKRATGATVLLAHHDGKDDQKGPRGGSALRHDMDTVIALKLDGDVTTARCVKQKDLEPFRPFAFSLRRVGLDDHADLTSCVIDLRSAASSTGYAMLDSDRQALACLQGQPDGVSAAEWERQSGLKHRTFYNVLQRLRDAQVIVCMRDRYHLTPNGLRALRTGLDDAVDGGA